METLEFIAEIRRRTGCPTAEAALRAGRATLMTLGERLTGDQPRHLAAWLPPELAEWLLSAGATPQAALSPKEFLRRVSEREGVDLATARVHAQVVVEVLRETIIEAERSV